MKEREIDASWPAAGLPDGVHADNGADFRSHALAWACREEGIKLIFRPVGAPHYGGHIERLIGAMMIASISVDVFRHMGRTVIRRIYESPAFGGS
ncbi:hypothetical protein WOC76_23820 [Methylocystis sp. IM3]|uniref:hypothetical protein n=1 Tax=Methylocystis sp. IM3 TaxID=3136722 RepID=UPI00311995B4